MPIDRPTFSESWHRVSNLKARLRATVQVRRQRFRGQTYYVLQDASGTEFFKLAGPAYHFIGLLDGKRTVAQAWRACNEAIGDDAPTQGEAIQLLGQLYSANLLMAEFTDDAETMLRRYHRRIRTELRGRLMNLLFVRIPLWDPNEFLDRWGGVFGRLFTGVGLGLWLILIAVGLIRITGSFDILRSEASACLSVDNLLLLYVAFGILKMIHELSHAFACKALGMRNGTGGEVHVIGLMMLVFMPVPYVDVTSAWAFQSKWQRIRVAVAGMYAELAVAAIAAIVWSNTAEGAPIHLICSNIVLIASISTLLFNGNPLLRYDGYFILADLLEIPNLAQRSKEYVYYLVKRYLWGIRTVHTPARDHGERKWLLGYAISSAIYRTVICVAILLFVIDRIFVLGTAMAVVAVVSWAIVPLARFGRYLLAAPELATARPRALITTMLGLAGLLVVVGLVPMDDHAYSEGVAEPEHIALIHAGEDGFVDQFLPSGIRVEAGSSLVTTRNRELAARQIQLQNEYDRLQVRRQIAANEGNMIDVQKADAQLSAGARQINHVRQRLDALTIRAPFEGVWVSPDIDQAAGQYLRRGDNVGTVATIDRLIIRVTADQSVAARILTEAGQRVDARVMNRPDIRLDGTIKQILPAGQNRLPSAALGLTAGGTVETDAHDPRGTRTAEPVFEIKVQPDANSGMLAGQRVVVRFTMKTKPIGLQWLQAISRVFQRRFHT